MGIMQSSAGGGKKMPNRQIEFTPNLKIFIELLVNEMKSSMAPDYLYTVPELARILKTGQHKVLQLIHRGHLNALKLGRYKVTKEELQRFLKESEGMDLTDLNNIKPLREDNQNGGY